MCGVSQTGSRNMAAGSVSVLCCFALLVAVTVALCTRSEHCCHMAPLRSTGSCGRAAEVETRPT